MAEESRMSDSRKPAPTTAPALSRRDVAALMLGVYAGDAAVLLLIVILTAIATTKVPILSGWTGREK